METHGLAADAAACLETTDQKLVLAESCTGGLIAASLSRIPGISGFFCGSSVVYRPHTKLQWLGIDAESLALHSAESAETTNAITQGVLNKTPEATIALGVTGHFGPGAPKAEDGRIYLAIWKRTDDSTAAVYNCVQLLDQQERVARQTEATCRALQSLKDYLSSK